MSPRQNLQAVCLLLALAGGAGLCAEPTTAPAAFNVRRSAQELWRAGITPPPSAPASKELESLAAEVQALTPVPKPPAAAKPAPVPAATTSTAPAEGHSADTQPAPAVPPPLDPNTVRRLRFAPLEGPAGKLALADALFQQDQPEAALALYSDVLAQDKEGVSKDWCLFQMANCLRASDANAARATYKRLASECPASPWADLAAVQSQLLDWQEQEAARSRQTQQASAAGTPATTQPAGAGRATTASAPAETASAGAPAVRRVSAAGPALAAGGKEGADGR